MRAKKQKNKKQKTCILEAHASPGEYRSNECTLLGFQSRGHKRLYLYYSGSLAVRSSVSVDVVLLLVLFLLGFPSFFFTAYQ